MGKSHVEISRMTERHTHNKKRIKLLFNNFTLLIVGVPGFEPGTLPTSHAGMRYRPRYNITVKIFQELNPK
jgi:hypothetical protein